MYGGGARRNNIARQYVDETIEEKVPIQSRGYNAKSLPRNSRTFVNKNFRDGSH